MLLESSWSHDFDDVSKSGVQIHPNFEDVSCHLAQNSKTLRMSDAIRSILGGDPDAQKMPSDTNGFATTVFQIWPRSEYHFLGFGLDEKQDSAKSDDRLAFWASKTH